MGEITTQVSPGVVAVAINALPDGSGNVVSSDLVPIEHDPTNTKVVEKVTIAQLVAASGAVTPVSGLVYNSSAAAAANTAALQAALNNGGLIAATQPGDLYFNATLLMGDNTELDFGPKTNPRLAPGSNCLMVTNTAFDSIRNRNFGAGGAGSYHILNPASSSTLGIGGTVTSITSAGAPLGNLCTATIPNTDPGIGSVNVGDWVAFMWAGTGGYGGVQQILSKTVGGSNTTLTYQTTLLPKATTCAKLTSLKKASTALNSAVLTNVANYWVNGSNTVNTADLQVGMAVTGTGVPANTVIVSIDSASQVTLNNQCTANGANITITFTYPLQYIKANKNITVRGGNWNYDAPNNWTTTGSALSSGVSSTFFWGYVFNLKVNPQSYINTGSNCCYWFNVRKGDFGGSGNISTVANQVAGQVCYQGQAPFHDVVVHDVDTQLCGDDAIAIAGYGDQNFCAEMWGLAGDIDGFQLERVNTMSLLQNFSAYSYGTGFYGTRIHVKQFSGSADNNNAGATYHGVGFNLVGRNDGAASQIGSFDDITLENFTMSNLAFDLSMSNLTIDTLRIVAPKYNRPGYVSSATPAAAILFGAGATMRMLDISNITFTQPLQNAAGAAYYINVSSTASIGVFAIRDTSLNNAGASSATCYFVSLGGSGTVQKVSFKNVIVENCNLAYVNQAVDEISFSGIKANNATQAVGRYLLDHQSGTIGRVHLDDVYMNQIAAMYHPRGAGSIITKLTGSGISYVSPNQNSFTDAATTGSVTPYSFEIPCDVGTSQIVAANGAFAYHTSAVAGRNGAAQQGPAMYDGAAHWYRPVSGAAGASTLIV